MQIDFLYLPLYIGPADLCGNRSEVELGVVVSFVVYFSFCKEVYWVFLVD